MITLTKISETQSKITLGWTPVPGCIGYVFYADDVRVSNTWDPAKSQVSFSKGPVKFRVDAVGVEDTGSYPSVTPPPVGTLRWKPPGYPNYSGYTTIAITSAGQNLSLDNAKDYVLDMSTVTWSSAASGRSIGLNITGGRNVVVIGGKFSLNRTNNLDDSTAIIVSDGADGGTVHLEGLDIDCANGITLRTRRAVQIENCRIRVWTYQDDSDGGSGIHPDIVQVWGTNTANTPVAAIRMHKVSGFTRYSGLVCLVEKAPGGVQCDPLTWERYEVDLHPDKNINGTMDAGNFAYHCSGPTGQANGPYCVYKGDVYAELPTGGGGSYTRPIDGIVVLRYITTPLSVFPYEIHKPDGTVVYTSPAAPTGGNGPLSETQKSGNYLTMSRVPEFVGQKWIIGKPSNGDFCPAGVPGPNYVSPGYL